MAKRLELVFIRKSTQAQDDRAQTDNVKNMLADIGVRVPQSQWFGGTVSRRKVKNNPSFARMMELVESGQVDTVFIESQSRWGTKDRVELFHFLGILRTTNTRLFDLRAGRNLAEADFASEMNAILGSYQSEKDLRDIAYQSLRTRLNNFKATGSWPTGPHPFGYGKACYSADGRLLWVWQPKSRTLGQQFSPGDDGELRPGTANIKIPRKAKTDRIVLVPNAKAEYVEAVKTAFDLYTRAGVSRRQISTELNAAGLCYYDKPFTHSLVTLILSNPAYVGDTHFGKTLSGELTTFDSAGLLKEIRRPEDVVERRKESDRVVMQNTHEPLVDRATWKRACEKLKDDQARSSYAPRNPNYFLKQLFVCGHCGKNLAARTEKLGNGDPKIVYVCSSYVAGKCNGHPSECGYHRIEHADAERMLLDKIRELNIAFDPSGGEVARKNARRRLKKLEEAGESFGDDWRKLTDEAVDDCMRFLSEAYDLGVLEYRRLRKLAANVAWQQKVDKQSLANLPLDLAAFKEAILAAEAKSTEKARARVAELSAEHRDYTKAWVRASEMQQGVMREELDRIETELAKWKQKTEPVWSRIDALFAEEDARHDERVKLLEEIPALESREKGEAFRRVFRTVTLYWDREFRTGSADRERKTDRPGRYRYTLLRDRIEWSFTDCEFAGGW